MIAEKRERNEGSFACCNRRDERMGGGRRDGTACAPALTT